MITKDILVYKGFVCIIHFSEHDGVFYGKIEGISDLVTFEGETVKELTNAFHAMVDEHIQDDKDTQQRQWFSNR